MNKIKPKMPNYEIILHADLIESVIEKMEKPIRCHNTSAIGGQVKIEKSQNSTTTKRAILFTSKSQMNR